MNAYSKSIAGAISHHLQDHEIHYSFDREHGVFTVFLWKKSRFRSLVYHIFVYQNGFTASAHCPVSPSPEDREVMTNLTLFLTRVNYGIYNGNFELDLEEGDINFKVYCSCQDINAPTDAMVEEAIRFPAAMFDKYEEGILGILFGDMDNRRAEDLCEKREIDRLMSRQAMNDSLEDGDEDETENEDEDEDEDETENEDEDEGETYDYAFLEEIWRKLDEKANNSKAAPPDGDCFDCDE